MPTPSQYAAALRELDPQRYAGNDDEVLTLAAQDDPQFGAKLKQGGFSPLSEGGLVSGFGRSVMSGLNPLPFDPMSWDTARPGDNPWANIAGKLVGTAGGMLLPTGALGLLGKAGKGLKLAANAATGLSHGYRIATDLAERKNTLEHPSKNFFTDPAQMGSALVEGAAYATAPMRFVANPWGEAAVQAALQGALGAGSGAADAAIAGRDMGEGAELGGKFGAGVGALVGFTPLVGGSTLRRVANTRVGKGAAKEAAAATEAAAPRPGVPSTTPPGAKPVEHRPGVPAPEETPFEPAFSGADRAAAGDLTKYQKMSDILDALRRVNAVLDKTTGPEGFKYDPRQKLTMRDPRTGKTINASAFQRTPGLKNRDANIPESLFLGVDPVTGEEVSLPFSDIVKFYEKVGTFPDVGEVGVGPGETLRLGSNRGADEFGGRKVLRLADRKRGEKREVGIKYLDRPSGRKGVDAWIDPMTLPQEKLLLEQEAKMKAAEDTLKGIRMGGIEGQEPRQLPNIDEILASLLGMFNERRPLAAKRLAEFEF